ncbi:MAG TPA: serine protease [Sandaracinaceae bacterium LLY-WYZ-13_1]|nr:serine protease [Sandaracinaceae bacterium LLY-WYZ-13_1]
MKQVVRSWVTLAALAVAASACGGSSEEPSDEATSGAERIEETGSMATLAEGQEAPDFPQRPIAEAGGHPHVAGLLRPRAADAPPADTRELYHALAPATVIVRSTHSMGTGVIVGPDGLILTNNHVIESAELDGFRRRVTVEFGRMGDTGSMVPDGEQRTAWVLETDPSRDLALLRVEEPPDADAPIVALAAEDPTPGETVICLGHGNVGMVWAIRRCQVQATGRLEETYARLQAVCGSEESLSQLMCRQMREHMDGRMHGLMVQSSCVLAPGDSGGPLVDGQGNLVGLNVMTIRNEQNQHSNFHVHAREIRDFLRVVPEEPAQHVPTPYLEEPLATQASDLDLDGRWDTVALRGRDRTMVRLHDLDQDTPDFPLEDLSQVLEERRFDAEVAMVSRGHDNYVWYDTDADGRLDLLLTLNRTQGVEAAHTVDAEGRARETNEGRSQPALSSARVPAPARPRFEAIFDDSHGFRDDPSPLPGLLRRGIPMDSDRDGSFDTLRGDRVFVHALAFDVDQDSLQGLRPNQIEGLLREGRFDPEVSLIRRGPFLWAFYDRDGDGELEAGLRTAAASAVVAAAVPAEGAEARALAGTLVMRADWLGESAEAWGRMLHHHVPNTWVIHEGDTAGLPDPLTHHDEPTARASYTEDGWENHVVSLESRGFTTTAVDVDRSSFRGRGRRHLSDGLEQAVSEGHFAPDFAMSGMPGATWAWYDTDLDGAWDVVLARVVDGGEMVRNAWRRGEEGFARDEALIEGRLVRPSLFERRHRRRFRALAESLFAEDEIEEAE